MSFFTNQCPECLKMMFSVLLLGTFGLISCETGNSQTTAATMPAATDGKAVFKQYCVACHGADGKLGLSGAKDLTVSVLSLEERINIISKGKNMMTPFNEVLSETEIEAVAQYTLTLKKQ